MLIDCAGCAVRGDACGDCVVSAILGAELEPQLTGEERMAIDAFSRAGFDVSVISEPAEPVGLPTPRPTPTPIRPPLRLMPGGRRRRKAA